MHDITLLRLKVPLTWTVVTLRTQQQQQQQQQQMCIVSPVEGWEVLQRQWS